MVVNSLCGSGVHLDINKFEQNRDSWALRKINNKNGQSRNLFYVYFYAESITTGPYTEMQPAVFDNKLFQDLIVYS